MRYDIFSAGALAVLAAVSVFAETTQPVSAGPSGAVGVWQAITVTALNAGDPSAAGDFIQSIVADPANPGVFYLAAGNNDGRKITWLRTGNFGDSWDLRNNTDMSGNPWGFSIDPNPNRLPGSPPTLYSPAGYGSFGAWKSAHDS